VGTRSINVTVNPLPTVSVSGADTVCAGTIVGLTASGATSYSWSPSSGLSCINCANPNATPSTTTTYTVIGTDNAGCKDTETVTIRILSLPNVSAGRDTFVCKLNSIQLSASGAKSYVWTPAATLNCDTCISPIASPATTTTYTVTGTDSNGCVNTDQIKVSIYTQPSINAGPDQTICAGQSAQLQASGGVSYLWSPAGTLSCSACSNPVSLPLVSIDYTLVGMDNNGCSDSDKVHIEVIQRDTITISQNQEICEGESVQLLATGGSAYTWYPAATLNNATIANPTATPTDTTKYYVIIKQGTCFADTLSTTVIVHPLPTIDAGDLLRITAGSSVVINTTGTNISTYAWSPTTTLSCTDCPNPTASPDVSTTYTVRVASEYGCLGEDTVRVIVTCEGNQIWLPNTFTPNADGQNDRFYPHGKGIRAVKSFRIYNRWGEVMYERTNFPTENDIYGWDGTYKNQPLKPDVYVYYLSAECTSGEQIEVKGDITLIK
jgi:gliding motility-associated-like protein